MSPDQAKDATIRAAIISTDNELRDGLGRILAAPGRGVEVGAEIGLPFTEITEPWLETLRDQGTELTFVDLEADARIGLKFAEFLIESELTRTLVAIGSDPSPELLLDAMRVGAVEFLRKPVAAQEVTAALERVHRKLGRRGSNGAERPAKGRAILTVGVKGGAGATTVGTNLAVELHRITRTRTLLVDLDLELGDTALLLGMEPRFGTADLLENFHRVDSGLLASYIERHESGVELLAAPARPGRRLPPDPERLRKILAFLKGEYGYVVVDVPRVFDPAGLAVLSEADEIHLVTTPDLPSLRNLGRTLTLLRQNGTSGTGEQSPGPDRFRLLVNRAEPTQLIPVPEIEETVGMSVFGRLRNDYRSILDAATEGRPAAMTGGTPFSRDLRRVAAEVAGVPIEEGNGGAFKRILGGLKRTRS